MAKAKKAASKSAAAKPSIRLEPIRPEEKIARLLGLIAIQNIRTKPEQAALLRGAGFTIPEMVEILDLPDNNAASVLLYQAKQKKAKKTDATD
jgi:hypothetical protein